MISIIRDIEEIREPTKEDVDEILRSIIRALYALTITIIEEIAIYKKKISEKKIAEKIAPLIREIANQINKHPKIRKILEKHINEYYFWLL